MKQGVGLDKMILAIYFEYVYTYGINFRKKTQTIIKQ